MLLKIPRLYDSHTHFLATGQVNQGLSLFSLKNPEDIGLIPIREEYFRGEWLVGFGWNENNWSSAQKPTRQILDRFFPDRPVFFSRADGHSSWLNSMALQKLGMLGKTRSEWPDPEGGRIERDEQGLPSGVLSDAAHMMVFPQLPPFTEAQTKAFVKRSISIFNQSGFTHVRDMSCTSSLWQVMHQIQSQGELTLAYEGNFTLENRNELDATLGECLAAKKDKTDRLRVLGLKIFYDGSLGSETALLSKPYGGAASGNQGLITWNLSDVKEVMIQSWQNGLEFSVHTIGDEAAHQIVKLAREVSAQGHVGRLNLEHVQVLRPETIQLMKPLHVKCHMQPCHWLSDRAWLPQKLGSLYQYAFPWESLRLSKIPLFFGSDTPIEKPSFFDNKKALELSAGEGIKALQGDAQSFHSHPDAQFMNSITTFDDDNVLDITIEGTSIPLAK